jgi:hypothetical protein
MSYAQISDVQDRMIRCLSEEEQSMCSVLLEDAAVMIDAFKSSASDETKKLVSCRMVIRAIGDSEAAAGIPIGASQGSISALGYSQSWTLGTGGGGAGELYLSKAEKKLLGVGNRIGSYSPVQEFVPEVES